MHIYYWREKNMDVDFVIQRGDTVIGIEVKSSFRNTALPGLEWFDKKYRLHKKLLVGSDGFPVGEFLQCNIADLFKSDWS